MNELRIKGNWSGIRARMMEKYAELSENDLRYSKGKSDELLDRLQKKTGKTREELKREIESF